MNKHSFISATESLPMKFLAHQRPVVRKAVSTDPGLKVELGFDFSPIKAYIRANGFVSFYLSVKLN